MKILTAKLITVITICTSTLGLSFSYGNEYNEEEFTETMSRLSNEVAQIISDQSSLEDRITFDAGYESVDFCFASHVKNCELHGYEIKITVPYKNFYGFLSGGQLSSKRSTIEFDQLDILHGEIGIGVRYAITETIRTMTQIGYYSAGEKEEGQTNSNSGAKIKFIIEKDLTNKMTIGGAIIRDLSQNSSDYRDHNLSGLKPKMYYSIGEIYSKYRVTENQSIIIEVSTIVKPANPRRTTIDDPDRDHDDSLFNYKIKFETAF